MSWVLVSLGLRLAGFAGIVWALSQERVPMWAAMALGAALGQLAYDLVMLQVGHQKLRELRADKQAMHDAARCIFEQVGVEITAAKQEAAHYRRLYLQKIGER
jgi:hypothetical protein